MMGLNEEIGFWFTTLLTSGRESIGGLRSTIMKTLGKTTIGQKVSSIGGIRTWLSNRLAVNPNSRNRLRNEFIKEINKLKDENGKEKKDRDKIEKIKSWKQLAAVGLLGIITSIIPVLFTGGLFLGNFLSIMGVVSKIEGFSGQLLSRYATILNIDKMAGGNPKNLKSLRDALKFRNIKPDIESSDISQHYIKQKKETMTPVKVIKQNSGLEQKFTDSLLDRSISSSVFLEEGSIGGVASNRIEKEKYRVNSLNDYKDSNKVYDDTSANIILSIDSSDIIGVERDKGTLQITGQETIAGLESRIRQFIGSARKLDLILVYEDKYLRLGEIYNGRPITENTKIVELIGTNPVSQLKIYPQAIDAAASGKFSGDIYHWANKFEGYKYIKQNFQYFLKGSGIFDSAFDSYEDAQVLHYLYKYVITPIRQSMLRTFNIYSSTNRLLKHHIVDLLKNNFKKYWVSQLDSNIKTKLQSSILDKKWDDFVDKVFSDIFDERLFTSSDSRIERTIFNRLDFVILSKILYDSTNNEIANKKFDLKSLPDKISDFINDPAELMNLYQFFHTENAKSLFLNTFTEAFLRFPSQNILMVPNVANSYFGWTKEMLYIYHELPSRLANWFIDNPNVEFYSGVLYDVKDSYFNDINKKLFGIDISSVDFPESSRWFDLNVYDFLSVVVSHHMKSVMVSPKNRRGVIDTTKMKGLAADSISSLVVDFWKQVYDSIQKGSQAITLPKRIVELLAPIFEVDKDLNNPDAQIKAEAKAKSIIKTLLTTGIRDLFTGETWKIPEHHLYLFDVATLINSEIQNQGTVLLKDIYKFITSLFSKESFKGELMDLVDKIFLKEEKRQYIKNTKDIFIKSLKDLFIKNIGKLAVEDNSGDVRLIWNGYYNFYFSTGQELKGSDLLGTKNTYLFDKGAPDFKGQIKSDNKFGSAMLVGYDYSGNVWIIPASEINNLPKDIHEGFKDSQGNEYHNIYISDNGGNKLIGTVYFEKGEIKTKSIDSLYLIYDSPARSSTLQQNIPIFSSDFFAAYGYATGNRYITAIQDVTVNIEHMEAHKGILPDVKISSEGVKIQDDPPLNVKTDLEPQAEIKLAFLSNFLHQLYGDFDARTPERNILHVFDSLLQLHAEGKILHNGQEILYSSDYFKQLIDALGPTLTQLEKMVQYYAELDASDKESIKAVKLKQKEFYRTFQELLKAAQNHDLIKGTLSVTVLNNDLTLGDSITSADYKIIDGLNLALQALFGDVGILLLKTGLMSFKVKNGKVVGLDFRKHKHRDLEIFLNRIGIKTLYSIKTGSVSGERYLSGTRSGSNYVKTLEVYTSLILSGYRELFTVDTKLKNRYNTPQASFGNHLFEIYLDQYYTRGYHEEVMTKFLDNHFSKYVVLASAKSSRGVSKSILTGRQIMFKELVDVIQGVLNLKPMPDIGTGTEQMKRKVALYYLMPQFLHEFYLIPQSTQTIDWRSTHYFGEMRRMILSETSGELIYGNAKIVNPLFHIDKTNPATGFHIPFDPSLFSDLKLQQILWTLDYHEMYNDIRPEFRTEHSSIDNIWGEIKNPIKETYDRLYDILWNSPNNEFTLRFYQAHSTGVDQNKYLGNVIPSGFQGLGIKDGTKIEITLDRNDPQSRIEFNKRILSAIHYLAKYPYSFTVVKTGNNENLLYTSLLEILNEEFIKTSFSTKPNIIGNKLSPYAVNNYENWKNGYFDGQSVYHPGWNRHSEHWASGRPLWTTMNIYPVYLFSGANSDQFGQNDFAEHLINFFRTLTREKYSGIDEILKLV